MVYNDIKNIGFVGNQHRTAKHGQIDKEFVVIKLFKWNYARYDIYRNRFLKSPIKYLSVRY